MKRSAYQDVHTPTAVGNGIWQPGQRLQGSGIVQPGLDVGKQPGSGVAGLQEVVGGLFIVSGLRVLTSQLHSNARSLSLV